MGDFSMRQNTTASNNTAVGASSLTANTTGTKNVAVGYQALSSNTTADQNTAVGFWALKDNTTGVNNTAVGEDALRVCTTGQQNTGVGCEALLACTTGIGNTGIGEEAQGSTTTGENNTSLGRHAGYNVTTGDNNLCLGYNAGRSGSPSGEINTHSNLVCIGDNSITNSYIKVDWTVTSDERDKTDIQDITTGLDFVNQLKPKSFWFRKDRDSNVKHGDKRLGFIAQDILALEGSDPVIIDNNDSENLKYKGEHLVPILVNAIKELSTKVTALEAA